MTRAQWLDDRRAELLPTQYFHVVLTLPDEIAAIAHQNKATVYGILFRAAAETLQTIAADHSIRAPRLASSPSLIPGGRIWRCTLICTASSPAAAFLQMGLVGSPAGQDSSFPSGVSRLFRRLFLEYLQRAFDTGKLPFCSSLEPLQEPGAFRRYLAPLRRAPWVVFAKPPFAGPEQVLDYVGRYTHRVAISNNRLCDIEDGKGCFTWKDYRDHNRQKVMTVAADEFIRRFLLHVLPRAFIPSAIMGSWQSPSRTKACSLPRASRHGGSRASATPRGAGLPLPLRRTQWLLD